MYLGNWDDLRKLGLNTTKHREGYTKSDPTCSTPHFMYLIKGYALFVSHFHYACVISEQNVCTINRLFILQKKALRLIHFKERNAHSAPLFFKSKIVKLPNKIKTEHCLSSASMSTTNYLPSLIAGLYFPPLFITIKLYLQPKVI